MYSDKFDFLVFAGIVVVILTMILGVIISGAFVETAAIDAGLHQQVIEGEKVWVKP